MAIVRQVAWGKETTPGTAVTPTDLLHCVSETLQLEPIEEEIVLMRYSTIDTLCRLNSIVRGQLVLKCNYQEVAQLIYAILGSVDTTGVGPTYTHTSPASSGIADRVAWTIEIQRDSDAETWTYNGCVVTGLAFTFNTQGVAECTVDIVGMGEESAKGTPTGLTYADTNLFKPSQVTILDNVTAIAAVDATLNIVRPSDEDFVLGTSGPSSVIKDNGVMAVSGNFNYKSTDLAVYNKFYNETPIDFSIACDDGTHSCTVNMNNCQVRQATPHIDAREVKRASVDFISLYDTLETANVQTVTVNDIALVP